MKSDVKMHKQKRSKPLRSFFVVLLLLGVGGALLLNADLDWLQNKFKKDDGVTVHTRVFEEGAEQAEKENISSEAGDSSSSEHSIVSFAPEEEGRMEEEEQSMEGTEALNPYAQIVKQNEDNVSTVEVSKLKAAFNEYRLYIANANKLLTKFAADESYSDELSLLKKIQCSAKAQEVVLLLEFYNKQLLDHNSVDNVATEIKLLDSNLLEKIIKVKKVKISNNEQRDLKEKIKNKLHILTDYIFSPELQQSFIGK
jgi:hypothetical protein